MAESQQALWKDQPVWEHFLPLNTFSVLIIEDDLPTRTMLSRLVAKMDISLFECSTAASAEALLEEQSIDLVLLDLGLPDANGMDLLLKWQQRLINDEFVVIVVSGQSDEQRMIDSLRLGAYDFLTKPIRLQLLMAKVLNAARFHLANCAARHLSQQLSAVVDSVRDGLFVMDESGRIVWRNDRLTQMFGHLSGWSSMASPGPNAADLLSESKPFLIEGDSHSLQPGELLLKDLGQWRRLAGIGPDGHTFPVDLMVSELQGRAGQYVAVVRDLSESVRVAELERNFVSIVSHELRTPLTSVSGSLSLLAATEGARLSEPGVRMLDIARRNVGRLNRLIDDILDLEKLAQGQLAVHFKVQPLLALVRDSIEMESGGGGARNITIREVVDPALDDCVLVKVDEDRFRQVMANLLSNAIKFSPENSEILVGVEASSDARIRISVADQGPGIPEDFRDKLFMPFCQAENPASRRKGGSGLGLSIVKALVECMHGVIGFESTLGQGACFFIEFYRHTMPTDPTEDAA